MDVITGRAEFFQNGNLVLEVSSATIVLLDRSWSGYAIPDSDYGSIFDKDGLSIRLYKDDKVYSGSILVNEENVNMDAYGVGYRINFMGSGKLNEEIV